uniref:non-specific serine/threonine protein kinase n=1 Tax=Meloidogyne javanica TaxID=6303 RepID=A0A915LBQ4_MELJA
MKYKHCPLGHSDPQIYTHTQTPFFVLSGGGSGGGGGGMFGGISNSFATTNGSRRSFLSSSPQAFKLKRESFTGRLQQNNNAAINANCGDSTGSVRNSVQMRVHRTSFSSMSTHQQQHSSNIPHLHRGGGGTSASARPSISAGCGSGIRQPVALRALPPGHHLENRRWSLASLPSSSGYGTPGTNSAYSSQYSSQENLASIIGDMRIRDRFDSNESYACCLGDDFGGLMRPRSRSLTSPVPHLFERLGVDSPMMLSSVYKERFPKAKLQMENRLMQFLTQNAQLSGFTSQMLQLNIVPPSPVLTESATAIGDSVIHHRSSNTNFLSAGSAGGFSPGNSFFGGQQQLNQGQDGDPQLLRLISDGATRFLHHQLCEIAADCLQKSRDDLLNCVYFCSMSVRLDETLAEAEMKVGPESYKYLFRLVKQMLMIVSRTARLLECLEFNPDEFYQLLGDAEVAVREQLGSGSARVPDLPQYILTKLGLNKNLSSLEKNIGEQTGNERDEEEDEENEEEFGLNKGQKDAHLTAHDSSDKLILPPQTTREAPKEEDFENIRLISNGAYGAVYLVKHKKTRQRFALKKMKKHTLLLRNQVEQPFVVCFYGSFETKQHLCMLMEYVEGGDCASLLKSAGTLPIELARLYVAETVMAVEYLHSCGIVHRDLKPDNLLITSMGHIKLTDFGLSKIGLMNRTTLVSEGYLQDDTQQFKDNQLCGTPEYIAPEVILRQGYGKPVDWWALGVILYEFLVGIVPFLGDSPEALFANIINEEALNPDAESLIRMLLEKNPADRLGTMGGAGQVSSHPFFAPIDFGTILRQKAEFVPQLENDEDTSYFDSRTDRYNHDAESEVAEDDEQVPMFWSFSTASPRHSIVGGLELPIDSDDKASSGVGSAPGSISLGLPQQPSRCVSRNAGKQIYLLQEPTSLSPSEQLQTRPKSSTTNQRLNEFSGADVIPSAVILRRRFSSQRHSNTTNMSTSSSGTTGTGAGGQTTNTCSSTDSSVDVSHFQYDASRKSHGQLPRLAISPCASVVTTSNPSSSTHLPLQRRPEELLQANDHHTQLQHLSPVQERWQENSGGGGGGGNVVIRRVQKKRPSTVVHELVILSSSSGQQSPSCASVSSASSYECQKQQQQPPAEPCGPSLEVHQSGHSTTTLPSPCSLLPPPSSLHPINHRTSISGGLSRPIVIRKGAQGFGFTIRSVRLSEYYSIEHIVSAVREGSPAWEAGLRVNDLISHVHTQSVHNMTHPQLMHRLLSCGNELTVHVVPLTNTSIKEGEPRRNVGKPLRKKPLRTSSQKQTFMPRSVSSQEGVLVSNSSSNVATCSISSTSQEHQQQNKQYLTAPGAELISANSTTSKNSQTTKRLSIPSASVLLDSVRRKL